MDVVTRLAPEELPLLRGLDRLSSEEVVALFGRRRRGEPLGFGLAEAAALATPVVWMAVDEACRAAVGAGVARAGGGLRRLWRRGRGRPAPEPPVPPLDERQLAAVHARVRTGAREAGFDEPAAGALADCVVARLAMEPGAPAAPPAPPEPPTAPPAPPEPPTAPPAPPAGPGAPEPPA
ncbi:hypothetical protein ACIQI7_20800 [Kitasatospora sp. NPDC092039]|uniref:hypothetical protein n=1 Tax=Kitasatospora sp. NPDC092039 TaxID=3364086 RepID=UPI00380E906F